MLRHTRVYRFAPGGGGSGGTDAHLHLRPPSSTSLLPSSHPAFSTELRLPSVWLPSGRMCRRWCRCDSVQARRECRRCRECERGEKKRSKTLCPCDVIWHILYFIVPRNQTVDIFVGKGAQIVTLTNLLLPDWLHWLARVYASNVGGWG